MDHIPLPKGVEAHWKIPYIATDTYDGGPFLSFPQRKGWNLSDYANREDGIKQGPTLHNREPSEEEIQSFLQAWVYFGTIHEVWGGVASEMNFVTTDDSGNSYLSTQKYPVIIDLWVERSIDPSAPQETQRENALRVLKRLLSHVQTLSAVLGRMYLLLDRQTMAATIILGELLEYLVYRMYSGVLDIDTPDFQDWITLAHSFKDDLETSGCCPSIVARLMGDGACVSLLYYFCLLYSRAEWRDHKKCSQNGCSHLQIDPLLYCAKHATAACTCDYLRLDTNTIMDVLSHGRLPLVRLQESDPSGDEIARLQLHEDTGKDDFVAISHVWADGYGNPKDNSLPSCSLVEISQLVNALPVSHDKKYGATSFWIDTICVPVTPPEAKRMALERLREPYIHAAHILVLDSSLRCQKFADLDELELFAYLNICNWVGRLWTLQEGRLARRVWVQFKDTAIELQNMFNKVVDIAHGAHRSPIYIRMLLKAFSDWNATNLESGGKNSLYFGMSIFAFLRMTLQFRAVSNPSDEALCLFALANLDLAKVASLPPVPAVRMQAFWECMPSVPSGLAFSKYPQKLTATGMRWAPQSFMGVLSRWEWAGWRAREEDLAGKPSARGLHVRCPGYIYNMTWQKAENRAAFFFRVSTDWLWASIKAPWHPGDHYMPEPGRLKLAILSMKPYQSPAERNIHGTYTKTFVSDGVLGHIVDEANRVVYIKGIRHIRFYVFGSGEQYINDVALECSRIELSEAEDTLDTMDCGRLLIRRYLAEHPETSAALERWKPFAGRLNATSEECFLRRFIDIAQPDWRYVGEAKRTPENQEWCID